MITRRRLLQTASLAAIAGATAVRADVNDCRPFTADLQAVTTPDQAVQMLRDGYGRYLSAASLHCDNGFLREWTAEHQTPFACVLGCIDSRVPPEVIFDQQIGDIFVARVAGNLPTTEVIGSFEYATQVAGAKVIMVLGHSHCGAIKGAIDHADVGPNLTALLAEIEPAVLAVPAMGERSSHNHELVAAVAHRNVIMTMAALTARSPVLARRVAEGQLRIVGAIYDVDLGLLDFVADNATG